MKYKIIVKRISYGFRTFEVEANNGVDAETKALNSAPHHEFKQGSTEYEVEKTTRMSNVDK